MKKSKRIDKSLFKSMPDYCDYTAEEYDSGQFFIGGIDGTMLIERREDAELIAAALNLAKKYRNIKRLAERLAAEAEEFIRE